MNEERNTARAQVNKWTSLEGATRYLLIITVVIDLYLSTGLVEASQLHHCAGLSSERIDECIVMKDVRKASVEKSTRKLKTNDPHEMKI
jgi:hypothetical protein